MLCNGECFDHELGCNPPLRRELSKRIGQWRVEMYDESFPHHQPFVTVKTLWVRE